MKIFSLVICAAWLLTDAALAQSPVTLTIGNVPGREIPAGFCGLSFGAVGELEGHGGVDGHLFSPTNTQLITLFKNSGLRHLRIGGSTVEGANAAVPDHEAIDNVFGFARAADVKVMYSLRLLNGDPAVAAADARYIWEHHRAMLDCFAIGNEPDIKRYHYPPFGTGSDPAITNYTSYLAAWRKFAAAVTNAVPDAKFAGPDAANRSWAGRFAEDEKNFGIVPLITQHLYVGGSPWLKPGGPETIPAAEAISNMLSEKWVNQKYPAFYKEAVVPIEKQDIPFRMTEANDYLKGVRGASDAFASALWALDYLHWNAAHETNCVGVNFHNTEWLRTDTVYLDSDGNYQIHPKAYGIRAFDLGSRGQVEKVKIQNKEKLNLTAYAVGDTTNLFVTVINKEYGEDARNAAVSIKTEGFASGSVEAIFLQAKNGDVGATNGITLGGATMGNGSLWAGKWSSATQFVHGECRITVPAACAVIVKVSVP
ncbi:MAG TPA: glycosyl hydrolase family 79 C-terminal domain-containing protein [Verrucomicrobiae bacterium]|nr:glycosyl hydrolase family 79 C-terminal domain-containing protein [Verrucomicrobiae bacterium]